MSDYTPSLAAARAVFIDGAEGEFVGEDFDQMIEAVRAEEREKCAALIQPALTIDYITTRDGDLMQDPTMSANQALHRAAARIREKG